MRLYQLLADALHSLEEGDTLLETATQDSEELSLDLVFDAVDKNR